MTIKDYVVANVDKLVHAQGGMIVTLFCLLGHVGWVAIVFLVCLLAFLKELSDFVMKNGSVDVYDYLATVAGGLLGLLGLLLL
jgi:hypothetical protein